MADIGEMLLSVGGERMVKVRDGLYVDFSKCYQVERQGDYVYLAFAAPIEIQGDHCPFIHTYHGPEAGLVWAAFMKWQGEMPEDGKF